MELIDNINKTLKGDFVTELRSGSKVVLQLRTFQSMPFRITYQIHIQSITQEVLQC